MKSYALHLETLSTARLKALHVEARATGNASTENAILEELHGRGWYWGDHQLDGTSPGWWQPQPVREPVRTPKILWLILAVIALVIGSCFVLRVDAAEPEPAQVSVSAFAWKLYVFDQTAAGYQRGGDLFGGRVIASMPLKGGLHFGARGDASALTSDFDAANPASWRSLEGYAALSWPRQFGPITAGPAVMGGLLVPVTTESDWASKATWGGGARLGWGRSWAYVLVGSHGVADERSGTAPVRFLLAASLEFGRAALVGDYVSGTGGFARAGVAWRIPIPWGGK